MRNIYFVSLFILVVIASSCSISKDENEQEDLFLKNSIEKYYQHSIKFSMNDPIKYRNVFKKCKEIREKSVKTISSVEQNKDNVNVLIHAYANDLKEITKSQTFDESILHENLDQLGKSQIINKIKLIEYVALSELMYKEISENHYPIDNISIRTIPENIIVNKNQETKIEIILQAHTTTKRIKFLVGESFDERTFTLTNQYDSVENSASSSYLKLKTDELGKQQAVVNAWVPYSDGSIKIYSKKIEYIVK